MYFEKILHGVKLTFKLCKLKIPWEARKPRIFPLDVHLLYLRTGDGRDSLLSPCPQGSANEAVCMDRCSTPQTEKCSICIPVLAFKYLNDTFTGVWPCAE